MNDWENPSVNSINRLPARTFARPLASADAVLTDALEPESPWVQSMNGQWKFHWCDDPAQRPENFWQSDFDTDLGKLLVCTDPAKRVWVDAMGNPAERLG